MYEEHNVSDWVGRTIVNIDAAEGGEVVRLTFDNGDAYEMYHSQDCCESVYIESIVGDLQDLVGEPLITAEEVRHEGENPEGVEIPEYQDSFTWTFYKFSTRKGYVDIRWYGGSNGYYSESVDIVKVN